MIAIALVERNCESRSKYLAACPLPSFYMEDFSIIGITVTDFSTARDFLCKSGYSLVACPGGGNIHLTSFSLLPEIIDQLAAQGIDAMIGDVADTIYQA